MTQKYTACVEKVDEKEAILMVHAHPDSPDHDLIIRVDLQRVLFALKKDDIVQLCLEEENGKETWQISPLPQKHLASEQTKKIEQEADGLWQALQ